MQGIAGTEDLGLAGVAKVVELKVVTRTLRFASKGFVTDAVADTPNEWVDDRAGDELSIARSLASAGDGSFGSLAEASIGEILLQNADGALDDYPDLYAIQGRPVRVMAAAEERIGREDPDAAAFLWDDGGGWETPAGSVVAWESTGPAPGAATTRLSNFGSFFVGAAQAWTFEAGQVRLTVVPDAARLDQPIQTATYLGQGGISGGPDLEGRTRPLALGQFAGAEPALVDAFALIYQVSDGQIAAITDVRDKGVSLDFAGDYDTYEQLEALAPEGSISADDVPDLLIGQYATCLREGCLRLGGAAAARVVCDGSGSAVFADVVEPWADGTFWDDGAGWLAHRPPVYASGARHLITRILVDFAGVPEERIDRVGIEHLGGDTDGSLDPSAGLYLPSGGQTTAREAVSRLAASAGCVLFPDRAGVWRARPLELPAGSGGVVTLTDTEIASIENLNVPYGQPWPRWRVAYDVNSTVLTATDLAPDARPEIVSFSTRDSAFAEAIDPLIGVLYPNAPPGVLGALLVNHEDAQALAERLLAFYARRRRLIQVTAYGIFAQVEFFDPVVVRTDRLGLGKGRTFVALRVVDDLKTRSTTLVLFG